MSLSGYLQHNNTHIELSKSPMSNKLFFSQNLVLCLITTKSTTLKFNNHFSFPLSLKCSSITTSQSESITQPFAVSYLINNFDFSTESALKAFNLRHVRFNTPDRPDSVINFLKSYGFSNSNIRIIIKKAPWLLSSQPHKMLLPKFQFFLSDASYSSDIIPLLTAHPRILQGSLERRIIPFFELLSRYLKTNKDIIVCLIRYWTAFSTNPHDRIVSNINLMVDFGFSDSTIARLLRTRPSIFGSNDMIKLLEEIKGLGFKPSTTAFGTALMTKQLLGNILWDKKVDVFKKWGWSDEDVIRVFRSQPGLMLTSIDKINLVMSFWVNQMGWDPLALTKNPLMFSFSLPKRIIPRASVLQFLLMKGLRKKKASLVRPFAYSDDIFLNKYVFSFKEESDYLLKLYNEKMKLANATENNGMPSTKCVMH
ncbi:putative transcription regulator mTERF family [Medicago truncatula]|uniref:Putative transcription regulator mTERF family n=1 Tax=Medicago truncatula TaxID=3880 RepID=A0A072V6D5_MEDTR|nr:uncharacterized protein LOC25488217 [Medicago truncatula]KEH37352.1 mTERF protein [Medicago truncatula]RHN73278.1 putative transcription regulator mTERF family [Medicago truncatula]